MATKQLRAAGDKMVKKATNRKGTRVYAITYELVTVRDRPGKKKKATKAKKTTKASKAAKAKKPGKAKRAPGKRKRVKRAT